MTKGPGILPTFLYYFSGTALVSTLLAVKALNVGMDTGIPSQLGLVVGLFGGVVGAFFNRSVVLEVPFKHRKNFLKTLNSALAEMGYELAADTDDGAVYERSPLRQLLSGKVFVQISGQTATICSRSIHIKALRKRLK